MKITFIITLFLIMGLGQSETNTRTPDSLNNNERSEYISKSHYQILYIQINKSSLKDINNKLGKAEEYDGEHTARHLCYVGNNQKIEFMISSLGYGYEVKKITKSPKKCGVLDKKFRNEAGLEIGIKKSDVLKLLGKPSSETNNEIHYKFWIQEQPSKEEDKQKLRDLHKITDNLDMWFDIISGINIEFEKGIVSKFSIYTSETY
ncbi:MAG: hypothetical protein L3J51_03865 [Cocleimonas sp.]|nr:hypothetical protein [Cocleimonas sp.]